MGRVDTIGGLSSAPGGNIVSPAQWDDLRFSLFGERLESPASRIQYNFAELTVDFGTGAVYPDDLVGLSGQMPHRWKLESTVGPHLHWYQTQAAVPNWLLAYRFYKNGSIVPAVWSLLAATAPVFSWSSGVLTQISAFPSIDMTGIDTVSAILDFKLYRDRTNVSGLFSGADTYAGDAMAKEFDMHFQIDAAGSREEYTK